MSTRRTTLALLCASLLAGTAATAFAAEEKVLNIANWAEYIGEDTVRRFEQETGIQVRYDLFDSNEVLLAKMVAGRTGYDIVVPSSDFAHMMLEGGVSQKLEGGGDAAGWTPARSLQRGLGLRRPPALRVTQQKARLRRCERLEWAHHACALAP